MREPIIIGAEKNALSDAEVVSLSKQETLDGNWKQPYSALVHSHTQSSLLPIDWFPQLLDG